MSELPVRRPETVPAKPHEPVDPKLLARVLDALGRLS
jgi:hypothetical protein